MRQAKLGSTHPHRLALSLLCGGVRVQVLAFVGNEVIMTGGRGVVICGSVVSVAMNSFLS